MADDEGWAKVPEKPNHGVRCRQLAQAVEERQASPAASPGWRKPAGSPALSPGRSPTTSPAASPADQLVDLICLSGHMFNYIHCSALLSTLARLPRGGTTHASVSELLLLAKPLLPFFPAHNLANTVWALAKLGHSDAGFIGDLLEKAQSELRRFNPQNLANIAWALAKMEYSAAGFMSNLLKEGGLQLPSFKPLELSSMMWALGTMGHSNTPCIRDFWM
ncbi:hypothetical protein FOA52_014347 [Chlamydomonas sp. UWO 241]|nr:hypothetical protein FOA52_014347 [Chlamydomonas sp. UWO 241]